MVWYTRRMISVSVLYIYIAMIIRFFSLVFTKILSQSTNRAMSINISLIILVLLDIPKKQVTNQTKSTKLINKISRGFP